LKRAKKLLNKLTQNNSNQGFKIAKICQKYEFFKVFLQEMAKLLGLCQSSAQQN